MENNDSNMTFNKADGKPIKFNFQLANGLPYKPIITPKFKLVQSKTTQEFGIYIILTEKDLNILKLIEPLQYKLFNNNEFWLTFDNCYIVLSEFNDKIIKEIQNNNLIFYFFNESNDLLEGFKLE